jgi:hypothetical protein
VTEDEKKLGELLAPLVREGRPPVPTDHPTPEELAAYHANELTPEEDERIREHLVVCRECSNLVLGLQALLDAAYEEPSNVADLKQVAVRNALREKVFVQPAATQAPVRTEPRRRRSALWPAWGLAALLAVAISGALVYRALLPDTPPAETQITTLDPIGSFRSGVPGIEIETVPRSNEIVLRVDGLSYSEYVAEIRQGGREVETLTGLREDEPLNVPLGALGSSLEPGDYEIFLFGLQEGRRKEAGSYQVRFVDS